MTLISVTGHRTLSHSFDDVSLAFCQFLKQANVSRVLTGMAIGFDQLVACACLQEKIPYEAIVPFNGQEKLWPKNIQEGYSVLIEQAEKKVVVSSGDYAAWKMHARNGYLVNNSDVIVAYLNPTENKGGTASCAKLANSKNKLLINIFPIVSAISVMSREEDRQKYLTDQFSHPCLLTRQIS